MNEPAMYVDGGWVQSASGRTREVTNPFNGAVIARVPEGTRDDAMAAIGAARAAFDHGPWPSTPVGDRAALLTQIGAAVRQHREELAELETLNTGKTLEESRWDMDDVAGVFDYYAELIADERPVGLDPPNTDATSTLVREPVGVCGQILPWNYPLLQAAWKMAPALAAGCTLVVKPSELTPLTTLRLTALIAELDLPRGVLNTVLGAGATVGAELAESNAVDLISFTGGIDTGKRIMRAAAGNVKRIALELGGKNPHIIFDDADFDSAVDYALNGVFFHAGQICSAGARLLVHQPIHDRFVEALAARMSKIRLGDGMAAGTEMGPLISAEHRAKVEGCIGSARGEGAKLVVGGARPDVPELQSGFFYLPTLFVDCTAAMSIVRQEVFGPVITVERFASEEEAVKLANDTEYGLSAGFWTRDSERIARVQGALRFGTVWVNDFNVYFSRAPWGGYKQSGIGRELGRAGLEEYQEIKHVYENRQPKPLGWFGA